MHFQNKCRQFARKFEDRCICDTSESYRGQWGGKSAEPQPNHTFVPKSGRLLFVDEFQIFERPHQPIEFQRGWLAHSARFRSKIRVLLAVRQLSNLVSQSHCRSQVKKSPTRTPPTILKPLPAAPHTSKRFGISPCQPTPPFVPQSGSGYANPI